MRWFDRLRDLERAMEDIEDPRGIEVRDLRDRVRDLQTQTSAQTAPLEVAES